MSFEFLDTDGVWKPVADDDPIYGVSNPGSNYTGQAGWDWHGKNLEGQQYRQSEGGSGGGGFEIPMVFPQSSSSSTSSSSLPGWGLDITKNIGKQLPDLMNSFNQSIDSLGNVPALMDDWVSQSGNAFLSGLKPFQEYIRDPLNKLAAQGVIDSTMARDSMTNLGGLIADDWTEQQTTLAAEANKAKADSLKDMATLRGSAAGLASNILNMAKQSSGTSDSSTTDQLAYYQFIMDLLTS